MAKLQSPTILFFLTSKVRFEDVSIACRNLKVITLVGYSSLGQNSRSFRLVRGAKYNGSLFFLGLLCRILDVKIQSLDPLFHA